MKELILKFVGVDYWSRPVYKVEDMKLYVGSLNTLLPDKKVAPNGTTKEINEYFRNNIDEIVIFGSTFDDGDPLGTRIKKELKIIIKD